MQKPNSCSGCPLHTLGRGFAQPEGKALKRLLVVAEALGENEARESLPLRPHAQAGSIFERALMALRLKRDDVVIQNVVNCQPPGNVLDGASYKAGAISHCQPNLAKVVEEFRPTAILALGGVALESLTGMKGRKKGISSLRGYVLWSDTYKLPVVATYHPAYIARGQKNLLGVFYYDILKAANLAQGKLVEGKDYYLNPQRDYPNQYNLDATDSDLYAEWQYLKANPHIPIAFDIETTQSIKEESEDDYESGETVVTQFQLSHGRGHALVLSPNKYKGSHQFFGAISNIMSLPNLKIGHNSWRFDAPILEANGVTIAEPHHDTMTLFHHCEPDVPAGLQYVASFFSFGFPWKHLAGEDLAWYGAVDVDVLHHMYAPLVNRLKKEGVYGE